MLCISAVAAVFGASSAALIVIAANFAALALAIYLSWLTYECDILPPSAIISIGKYVFEKLSLYGQLILHGTSMPWTRTDRKKGK
jgi:hypothetical protein